MFKHLFKHKDATLNQQNMDVYKIGRMGAYTILIVGSILSIILATWMGNFLQALLMLFLDGNVGLFSFNVGKTFSYFMAHVFTFGAFIHNEYLISNLHFLNITWFLYHGKMLASFFRLIGWIACEAITIKIYLSVFVKYRNINHHEKGDDRFATPAEVKSETNRVPDRGYRYDIPSGMIMMHQYNLRGYINDKVKQQLFGLKKFFQLDKDHDPSGNQFIRFYASVKFLVLTVLFVLLMASLEGGTKYNVSSSPNTSIAWYNPFHIFLFVWYIIHFIIFGIWDLLKDLCMFQVNLLSSPIYVFGLIYMVEFFVAGVIVYHILEHVHSSIAYDSVHSYINQAEDNPIKKYFKKVHSHHKKEFRHLQHNIQAFKDPKNCDLELEHEPTFDKKEFNSRPRRYLIHEWLKPVKYSIFHGKHPFYKRPLLALKMAWFQFLDNTLPLNSGITGWYYLTGGNGAMQNVLLYGITRSGKGQMIVNTITDINSRASHRYQKNMIFNDSKGELAASTYKVLKQRGYDVKVLNIMDMSHSMSYNPLALVIKQARAGAVGAAAKACSQLSYTIYNPAGQGQNSFFYTEAASLFDSIAFAQIAFAHSRYYGLDDYKTDKPNHKGSHVHDDGKAYNMPHNDGKYYKDKDGTVHSDINAWSRVTINNILQMTVQLGGEQAQLGGNDLDMSNQLMIYFEHLARILNSLRLKKRKHPKEMTEILNDHLAILNQAVQEFQNSKMAGSKTAGSIYSTFLDRLRIYQQPDVSQMTSMNNYDAEEMGFDRLFTIQFSRYFKLQNITTDLYGSKMVMKPVRNHTTGQIENKKVAEMDNSKRGFIEENKSHLTDIGLAKIPFEKPINYQTFYIKIVIHDERVARDFEFIIKCRKHYYKPNEYNKLSKDYRSAPKVADLEVVKDKSGTPIVIDKYTKQPALEYIKLRCVKQPKKSVYKNIAEQLPNRNNENTRIIQGLIQLSKKNIHAIRQYHFLYNPRPTALFLVTPPNATELNQLCTFLINQTFNILSTYSLKIAKGRHIQRPLQFILDELGNIPAIPNMSKKVSIGLSQHIEFLLVFQNYEQIQRNYNKEADSIVSNCSTTYYILSKSDKTLKQVSQACGTRTIYARGRNADPTKVSNANYNASLQAQPVMPVGKLRKLENGEIVILRSNDRSTIWGKNTKPYPIFDTGIYKLPYSFTFLKKYESGDSLNSLPVVTPHKYLNVEDVTLQFTQIYQWFEAKNPLDKTNVTNKFNKITKEVHNTKIGQVFKNDLVTILNAAQNSKQSDKIIKACNRVHFLLKKYEVYSEAPKIATVSKYALAVLTQQPNKADTLMDVTPKEHGDNLFDYLSNEYNWITEYYAKIKKQMEIKVPQKKYIKKVAPYLYESKAQQVLYSLVQFSAHHGHFKSVPNHDQVNQHRKDFEGFILNSLNTSIMHYLCSANILKIKSGSNNTSIAIPTETGKEVLEAPETMIKTFFSGNYITYKPDTPLTNIFVPIIKKLTWVWKHPEYNAYYGLAFMQGLVNFKRYKEFCTQTVTQNNKPVKRTWSLSPMTYATSILSILDIFFNNPTFSHKQGEQITTTQNCKNLMNALCTYDKWAGQLFVD